MREHIWFTGFDWAAFNAMNMEVPDRAIPELNGPRDVSAFTESDAPTEIIIKPYDADASPDKGLWCKDW